MGCCPFSALNAQPPAARCDTAWHGSWVRHRPGGA
jgi:hypothetical protein